MNGKRLALAVVRLLAVVLVIQLAVYLLVGLLVGGDRLGVGFFMFIGEFVIFGGLTLYVLYSGSLKRGGKNVYLEYSLFVPAYLGVVTSIILSWTSYIIAIPIVSIIAASIAILIDIACIIKCYKLFFFISVTEDVRENIVKKNIGMRAIKIEAEMMLSLCKDAESKPKFAEFFDKISSSPLSTPPEMEDLNQELLSAIKEVEDELTANNTAAALEKLARANIALDHRNVTIKNLRGKR